MRLYLPALFGAFVAAPLAAQSVPVVPAIVLGGGVMQYDLSGVGDATMYTARVEAPYTSWLLVEGGVVFARPYQQFGDTTNFLVVEGQLHAQWPLSYVRPYVGVGGGVATDFRDEADGGSVTRMTLSAAAGARAPLRDRLGMRAELRLRGVGSNFSGSTAEWTLALTWRL